MTVKTQRARPALTGAKTVPGKAKSAAAAADMPSMAEPLLSEMLLDPILMHLMQSDGVERQQLLTLLDDARARLFS